MRIVVQHLYYTSEPQSAHKSDVPTIFQEVITMAFHFHNVNMYSY